MLTSCTSCFFSESNSRWDGGSFDKRALNDWRSWQIGRTSDHRHEEGPRESSSKCSSPRGDCSRARNWWLNEWINEWMNERTNSHRSSDSNGTHMQQDCMETSPYLKWRTPRIFLFIHRYNFYKLYNARITKKNYRNWGQSPTWGRPEAVSASECDWGDNLCG